MRIGVFPGSFDPITIGHEDLVRRALPLFDKLVVAIGVNSGKKYLFGLEQRLDWLRAVFADEPAVEVAFYEGLTANFCRSIGARFILRGLRSSPDFEYEKTISQLNTSLAAEVDTVFLISRPAYSHISSSIVRELIRVGALDEVRAFIPKAVQL